MWSRRIWVCAVCSMNEYRDCGSQPQSMSYLLVLRGICELVPSARISGQPLLSDARVRPRNSSLILSVFVVLAIWLAEHCSRYCEGALAVSRAAKASQPLRGPMIKNSPRSKQQALEDITTKFKELPPSHPYKPTLARIIVALRAELASPGTSNGAGQAGSDERLYRL